MPQSPSDWVSAVLLVFAVWFFVGLPLWFMIVEEPRERRARAARAELDHQRSFFKISDWNWFFRHVPDDKERE